MGIMVVEDLERSDTVAREPTTRAKTIVIQTVRVRARETVECIYIYRGVHILDSVLGLVLGF